MVAMSVVSSRPRILSGISCPFRVTASVYMCRDTLRTDIRLVAFSVRALPVHVHKGLIGVEGLEVAPGAICLQVSPDDPQVVAQAQNHVLCVHNGYRVLKVDDVREGGLHNEVPELAVFGVNRAALVELELNS